MYNVGFVCVAHFFNVMTYSQYRVDIDTVPYLEIIWSETVPNKVSHLDRTLLNMD